LLLFGLLSIVASGGGGGTEEPETFGATSTGVAAKGIIQYGAITAEELNSSGNVIATVGTAETDATGAYSLSIGSNYTGGPILLTISGKSDGSTQMKCDVSAGCGTGVSFGQTMTLDTTFTMTAIVPPVASGASISAQITPYSHMAARRALAAATVDANAVNNAISEVNQMVGVNILEVPPVDITDPAQIAGASSEALTYAAFVAGAGEVALAGGDLQTGLDDLAQSFEDGELTDTDAVDPAALLAAVENEAAAGGIATDQVLSQVLAALQGNISGDCATGSCSYNPEPADTATQTAVEKARAVVAQTRAWGTTLDGLETPMDAFGTNMDVAGNVLDANSQQLGATLGLVLDAVGAELDAQAAAGSLALTTYTVNVIDNAVVPPANLGTATVTLSDNNGLNMAIAGTDLDGVDVTLTASSNLPAGDALNLINTGTATMTLSGLDLSFTGSVSNAQASMSLDQMVFSSTFDAPITLDPTAPTPPEPVLTSASLDGGLTLQAGGASFTGDASFEFVSLTNAPNAVDDVVLSKVSLRKVSLNGTITDGDGNSFDTSASLTVNNAADFDTLGALACGTDEYVGVNYNGDELNASAAAAANGIVSLDYAYYDAWSGETTFVGLDASSQQVSASAPGDAVGVTARLESLSYYSDCRLTPTVQDASFSYWAYPTPFTMISGTLVFPPLESASNFADLTLTLTMDLTLTGHPGTTAVLTANRTAYQGGDLTATFSHAGQNITFVVSKADGATPGEGTLTVTTPDGVKLAVTASEGDTSGTLKVGNTTVGTVEETSSGLIIVRYSDGTFETLQ